MGLLWQTTQPLRNRTISHAMKVVTIALQRLQHIQHRHLAKMQTQRFAKMQTQRFARACPISETNARSFAESVSTSRARSSSKSRQPVTQQVLDYRLKHVVAIYK